MITGDDNLQNILKLELDLDINNRNCFHEEVYEGQVQFRPRQHKNLINNRWSNVNYNNVFQDKLQILILVIPFEYTGAMEAFLLNAIAVEDEYDADIINKSNIFIERQNILKSVP